MMQMITRNKIYNDYLLVIKPLGFDVTDISY